MPMMSAISNSSVSGDGDERKLVADSDGSGLIILLGLAKSGTAAVKAALEKMSLRTAHFHVRTKPEVYSGALCSFSFCFLPRNLINPRCRF